MPSRISIKGVSNGLLIILGEGEWSDVHQDLLSQLDQQTDFLKGAKIALDVGNHSLKAADLGKLREEINDRDLSLWAVLSESSQTESTARMLGLDTQIGKSPPEINKSEVDAKQKIGEEALLIQRTLRSGFSLEYAGHVIVIGDVNPGAEIVASGNIIVWGRLRGLAHAGAEGDENAAVCALDLSPTQLRISDAIAITPKRRGKPKPEIAHLQNGQVIAEAWQPKREKK
jgi:septum site-determining protein MinC